MSPAKSRRFSRSSKETETVGRLAIAGGAAHIRGGMHAPRADQLTARVIDRIDEVSPADWNAVAGMDNPFLRHAFLKALEDSGSVGRKTGWLPQHLIVTDE